MLAKHKIKQCFKVVTVQLCFLVGEAVTPGTLPICGRHGHGCPSGLRQKVDHDRLVPLQVNYRWRGTDNCNTLQCTGGTGWVLCCMWIDIDAFNFDAPILYAHFWKYVSLARSKVGDQVSVCKDWTKLGVNLLRQKTHLHCVRCSWNPCVFLNQGVTALVEACPGMCSAHVRVWEAESMWCECVQHMFLLCLWLHVKSTSQKTKERQ